ncbi:MAG: hypothetical protein H8K04_01205 [Nitrospira sp.]
MDESIAFRRTDPVGHATTAEVLPKSGLELRIGSNIFRNTSGVVTIQGKEQLVIEAKPEYRLLFATADFYDEHGARIAHLRRNAFVLNEGGRFAVDVQFGQNLSSVVIPSVRVTDLQSSETILEARMASENRVHITCGKFRSHKGALVEITSHYCRISSVTTRFGDILETRGGPVVLG